MPILQPRYHKGQRFGAHIDEPVESEDRRLQSEFTLLLYLNGGEGSWGAPLKVSGQAGV